jgi:hypothetical protein
MTGGRSLATPRSVSNVHAKLWTRELAHLALEPNQSDCRARHNGSSCFDFPNKTEIGKIGLMDAVVRKVRDIDESERHVLEHMLGRSLHEDQQIIMQVVTLGGATASIPGAGDAADSDELPEWCNVYEGLTAQQIADLESVILERVNLSRPS